MDAAGNYIAALRSIEGSPHSTEPEAQLTRPVADLFEQLCKEADMGALFLQREAQLQGIRPDFAATIDGKACGWIELKAPGHSVDGTTWTGRERKQWAGLSELDALIVTDGRMAALYRLGELVCQAQLPAASSVGYDQTPLIDLLQQFISLRPPVIQRVSQLADRLAPLARLLRDRVTAGLQPETTKTVIVQAKNVWVAHIHEKATDAEFANDLAQVIAYSMAIAALRGKADVDGDGFITLQEARNLLKSNNAVLAASMGPVLDVPGLRDALESEIGAIERLVSVVDAKKIAKSKDTRGEPWLWFYEDFLTKYDPVARQKAGVFYTPTDVVQMQVRHVDYILRKIFGKRHSFGDKNVVTLDPCTGSGTYPLAIIDRAAEVAETERGPAGPKQASKHLIKNLMAFELLPGPYAVAHLRIGQRIADMSGALLPEGNVRVYLTDTLEDPEVVPAPATLWGDVAVLAAERELARQIKSTQPVTICIGNPPYERGEAASGKWIVNPPAGHRSLFADVIEPAQEARVKFSAQASLYNDYVYFWRWAIWKAFEQRPNEPAVVSFITASSWLHGPAFIGLRNLARKHADEMWITDLGGEGRGNGADQNVFAIQTPVAIVTLYRKGKTLPGLAAVKYHRVTGTKTEKLAALRALRTPFEDVDSWLALQAGEADRLTPAMGGAAWEAMPLLTDLFPWQHPGVKFNRTWPIAPDKGTLARRWKALLEATDAAERADRFVTAKTGRTIHTAVAGLPKLSELQPGKPSQNIVRYGYRSFDRQWTFQDPRLTNLERPPLWETYSDKQVYLSGMLTNPLGEGPALTVTAAVPDLHHFRGSYGGKDVIPLYRDDSGLRPNVTEGLLEQLKTVLGYSVTAEDLASYTFALMAHPAYFEHFKAELATPGPRVPITADAELFSEAVAVGRELLWLQTYGERLRDSKLGRGEELPHVAELGWAEDVAELPLTANDISYSPDTETISIGAGRLTGVRADVWDFSVSGYSVLSKWLGGRTRKGIGRAASQPKPLDRIRPEFWDDAWNDELMDLVKVLTRTVDLQPRQAELLEQITASTQINAADLPIPTDLERAEP